MMRQWLLDYFWLVNLGIVICLAWFLLRWKNAVQGALVARHGREGRAVDLGSVEMAGKFFTVGVLFVSLLVALRILGMDIGPLLAFSGIGAAALGIAGREVIANFFGGFMVHLTRPFTVDDFIELPERGVSGHIEEIGWYFTAVRDAEKRTLYLPNSLFATSVLTNGSRITHRRIEEVIHLRHEDMTKILPLVESIRLYLQAHEKIDAQQKPHVFLKALGVYALEIEVQAYTQVTNYEGFAALRQEVLLHIGQLIRKVGAEITAPITAVPWRH